MKRKKITIAHDITIAVRDYTRIATVSSVDYNTYNQVIYHIKPIPNYSSIIFYELNTIIMEEANNK